MEQEDLFKTHQYIRDEHNVFITFKCLQCGVLTDFSDSEKPPSYIQEILRDESN